MNIIEVNDPDKLDEFYEKWALTFEGTNADNENLEWLMNWFKEHGCTMKKEDFYVVSGKMMNDKYRLTGSNQYPNSLHILVILLEDLNNAEAIFVPRFEIGGRFWTDIVDNNRRREEE